MGFCIYLDEKIYFVSSAASSLLMCMNSKSLSIAAALLGISLGIWSLGGFHTGWTQTQIEVNGVDEITGIEYTTMEDGFVPGIEFPVAGLMSGIVVIGISKVVDCCCFTTNVLTKPFLKDSK